MRKKKEPEMIKCENVLYIKERVMPRYERDLPYCKKNKCEVNAAACAECKKGGVK